MKSFIVTSSLVFLAVLATTAHVASAAVTSTFNQESPGGALSSYVSNTWDVATGSDEWLTAQLLVELSAGDIYQDSLGTNNPPDASLIGANPSLEFDSYMTGGYDTDYLTPSPGLVPFVLGGAGDIGGGMSLTFNTTEIDAAWISLEETHAVGDLMLARVTLSDDAMGTFKYQISYSDGEPNSIYMLGGVIVNGVMLVPEPGSISFLLCGLLSLICWRRRK